MEGEPQQPKLSLRERSLQIKHLKLEQARRALLDVENNHALQVGYKEIIAKLEKEIEELEKVGINPDEQQRSSER